MPVEGGGGRVEVDVDVGGTPGAPAADGGKEAVEDERVIGFEDDGGGPAGDFVGGGSVAKEGRLTAAARTPVAVAGVVAVVLEAMMPVDGRVRFGKEFAAPRDRRGACVSVADPPPMSLRTIQAVSGRSLK